ncbi:MAG: U32 family peptidase [Gammaproteobacteria bacterium]|nr:U32 family peptidase [Gammaproteobacteria bacterium]
MELVCPAGNLPSLQAAIDNGADAVYIGFQDDTNARHFPGLNFTEDTAARGVAYAHDRGRKVFVAINTYPRPSGWERWRAAVDRAAALGADALIMADMGLMGYAHERHPNLALHLSVQGSATNHQALRFYRERFGVRRAVLPRVLSLAQVRRVASRSPVPIEVFGFGSLCIMAEGRCHLSSYLTGNSPNMSGVCSPAWAVRWEQTGETLEARLNGVLIDRYGPGEKASYPTLCKGRFEVGGQVAHALEEPTSLNTLELLPELHSAGVQAVKIEGRQRSPAYIAQVARVWRQALDLLERQPGSFAVRDDWMRALAALSEGSQTTLGAYHRPWQ